MIDKRERFTKACMLGKNPKAMKVYLRSATEPVNLFSLGAKHLDDPDFVLLPHPEVTLEEFFEN